MRELGVLFPLTTDFVYLLAVLEKIEIFSRFCGRLEQMLFHPERCNFWAEARDHFEDMVCPITVTTPLSMHPLQIRQFVLYFGELNALLVR